MNRLALIKQAISSQITFDNLKDLQLTREGKTATIWFNAPNTLNAISIQMSEQFKFLLPILDKDDSVKIIVLRSKHKKFFCVGADVKDFLLSYPDDPYNEVRCIHTARVFRAVRKPMVAIVQGAALGGGFELALACDIIICNDKASFGLPEITLGILPGLGGTQLLPRLVGTKVASRLILTGEIVKAEEAQRLNIAHLIQGQNFDQKVKKFLDVLQNKALDSLQAAKKAIRLSQETTLEQGFQHEATIFQALFNKKGPKEGLAAFVQKRKPNFKNI